MYYYWGFGIFMYNLKMSKTDINKLLIETLKERSDYGLIMSLQYIYGKNVGDVLELKKEDVDLDNNEIIFKSGKSDLKVPIVVDIYDILINHVNGLDGEEYLFLNSDVNYNHNVMSKRINYYLNNKIDELNKNSTYKLSKITNRDLKMLRGQHLYLENVPLEIIHELYNNFNLSETRKMINYEGLKNNNYCGSVEDVINHHTELNLFRNEDYVEQNIYMVMDMDDNYGVVEFVDNGMIVHERSKVTDRLGELNVNEIFYLVRDLGVGEFKFVKGFKFLK